MTICATEPAYVPFVVLEGADLRNMPALSCRIAARAAADTLAARIDAESGRPVVTVVGVRNIRRPITN